MSENNNFLKTILLGDDNEEHLPSTRKKQFFNVIKYNYGSLIIVSLLTFLFIIPLLICHYCLSFIIADIIDTEIIFYHTFNFSIIMIFCFLFLGLGIAGLSYYIRKLLWAEVVSIHDYFLGIKIGYKRYLCIFLIYGISYFIYNIDLSYYSYYCSFNSVISNLLLFLGILQFLIINVMMMYQINIEVRYKMSFKTLLYNSFRLTMMSLFKNITMFFLLVVPWVLLMIMPGEIQILILIVYLFVGFALFGLISGGYTLYIFDKFINSSNQYKIIYRKGLKK